MKFLLLLVFTPITLFAQFEYSFKYGAITHADLNMAVYAPDTSAVALVLNEFGNTYINETSPYDLGFEYHVRIKILKKEGLYLGNYEIPMRIRDSESETVTYIQASTFNVEENKIKESQ